MRLMHVMIQVLDLEKSIAFYTNVLKMQVMMRMEFPSSKFTLILLGYEGQENQTLIELNWYWEKTQADDLRPTIGHLAIEVTLDEITTICNLAKNYYGKVTREPGFMQFGENYYIAFLEDPDGHTVELIVAEDETNSCWFKALDVK